MDNNLNSFIDLVIEQKKLHFLKSETNFDKSLFEKGILKIEGESISVTNFELIAFHFLDRYKEKLNFQISNEFEKNIDFIQNIEHDFLSNHYVQDYHILEKEIWKTVLTESNIKFQYSFNEFLKSLDIENKQESIFQFIDVYSSLLPTLKLSSDIIFENSLIQLEITKNDVRLGSVLNGIKNKCKSDYEFGLDLLQKSLYVEEDKENLISAIISGLYENNGLDFYDSYLKNLIEKEHKRNAIFFGLANICKVEKIECELFLELIKKHNKNDSLIISVLSLVISILKSKNTEYHIFCFKELEFSIEREKAAYYILNNLNQIDNYYEEKSEIVVRLIKQPYFLIEKYINPISNTFWRIKDFNSFKKVTLCLIENKPFKKFIKSFQSHFNTIDSVDLDKFTVELLTDNQASKRFVGLEIFDKLSNYNPHSFSFDILEIPHLTQYKLWVSLTEGFHQPKNRLVALLPLLNSKSELIKESFICKLEEISEDYGGHITKLLKENLDQDEPNSNLIIERVKNYIENFYNKNANMKYSIAELNPYHAHNKYIRQFDELFSKKMNESADKGAKENSLLSGLGINTVQLSKGGGWRFGGKNEISQLGKVGTSFTMPRSYFINPNEYELEKGFLLRKDWTDEEFKDINIFLKNE